MWSRLTSSFVCLLAASVLAADNIPMPSQEAMNNAHNRAKAAFDKWNSNQINVPRPPNIIIPQQQPGDTSTVQRVPEYRPPINIPRPATIYVAVSTSMPAASLKRLHDDIKRVGGTLVFRGVPSKGGMDGLIKELKRIFGDAMANISIDPNLYKAFGITMVPTYILSTDIPDNACSDDTSKPYVAVAGDVGLNYALSYIMDHDPQWRDTAKMFLERL